MKKLVQEKEKAILLRKRGYSYSEILSRIPVAKSSLSLWLKDLPLTSQEKSVLKHRKDANISRGRIKSAAVLRQHRLDREQHWYEEARIAYEKHRNEPLFHTGIALYWAEGAKRATQWGFSNSDYTMIVAMLCWLERYADTQPSFVRFRLYLHKPYAHENCESWWARNLNVSQQNFLKTVYKATGKGVKKRPAYKGCIKIEVPRSKHLLCKMRFWQRMIVEDYTKG